jgi:RNA polymerase sigma-70 factor (ECF subfamily)
MTLETAPVARQAEAHARAISSLEDVGHKTTLSGANERDAELAAGVAERDRSSLELLYKEHGAAVKGVAWRVLKDENLAEDIVQETFVTFWDSPDKYDPSRGTIRTFLLTIAHRKAVDVVRSEVARSRREEKPPDRVHVDVEEEVWTRDLSDTVRNALNSLAEGEREAITMAYYGGLSYVQVAERLDLPEGTVKSRIRAGMKKLSVALSGVEEG